MRYSKRTQNECLKVCSSFGLSWFDKKEIVKEIIRLAIRHHSLQEVNCNQGLSSRQEACETNIELKIKSLVNFLNLDASFQRDPRGYTVRLHNKDNTVYNSCGGAEHGYGIGEK
jgi:hypothetical protein